MSQLQTQLLMVCREGILFKGTLARNPRCNKCRRIDDTVIITPAAVDQRAANCLEEADGHSPPCEARVDRHLPSSAASSSSCSVLVGPPFLNSSHCGTVPLHTSSYCPIGKSSFSKADNPPPLKLRKL
ncbi:hypothetical protein TNCV_2961741 [Trichonephila clavipes]|nr:hypothetical protein TNCV_2961741 [Trichonephila clavipes]